MIPETEIEAVRARVLIEDVIGETVALRRSGGSLMGRCPFHDDRRPSLSVKDGGFRCFGCGKSGDVFAFVMERDGLDFPAAVRALGGDVAGASNPTSDNRSNVVTRRNRRTPRNSTADPPSAAPVDPDLILAFIVFGRLGPQGRAFLRSRGLDPDVAEVYGFRSIEEPSDWAEVREELGSRWDGPDIDAAGLEAGPFGWRRPVLAIPFYGLDLAVDAIRFRNIAADATGGDRYRDLAGRRPSVPFNAGRGLRALREGADLHVTEGEFDCWTLHAGHGLPHVIGLPGATVPWRGEWSRYLHRARRVFLWHDGDDAGDGAISTLARLLGTAFGPEWVRERCLRPPIPAGQDVNDLHRAGELPAYVAGCA